MNQYFIRFFFPFSLLFPLFLGAQDCKLIRETDPYTKETKISTGFIALKGGSVTIDADSKEVDFLFTIDGTDKCFDDNCMAVIFFEGTKQKMNGRNGGTMNCEGLFQFVFRNTTSTTTLLQRLSTQLVNHIVFTGNDKKETTVSLTPAEEQTFMAMITCIVNEAKTLIK